MESSNYPNAQPDLPEDVLPEQIIILKNANTNSLEGLFHVRFKNEAYEKKVVIRRFEQLVVLFDVPADIKEGTYSVSGGFPGAIPTIPEYRDFGTVTFELRDK
ncbi:hypothetical protein OH720_31415 [Pseudomonas sp. WJP1]|uniref:hypothetical protein n=1 Tax=Pseudomonas sp. WJP1 TaxID=2986947 RepID=UPI00234A3263|nr:hypothetical protein [Pseudomonas sp. WJP1]WCM51385.1 hypothetical protein OH720_31415 [Pseudomonas sp. WJP1]